MKKISLMLLSLLLSAGLRAEVLVCDFTEPFFNIKFDPVTKVVTYMGIDTYNRGDGTFDEVILAKNAKLVETTTTGPVIGSEYSLRKEDDTELMKLALTFRGSNGMSDHVYPFEAWYGPYMGACETKSAPAVDTFALIDGLTD